jgi:hypothetical protein
MAQHMSVLSIDIATRVFRVVGMEDSGQVVLRKRIARRALRRFIGHEPRLRKCALLGSAFPRIWA